MSISKKEIVDKVVGLLVRDLMDGAHAATLLDGTTTISELLEDAEFTVNKSIRGPIIIRVPLFEYAFFDRIASPRDLEELLKKTMSDKVVKITESVRYFEDYTRVAPRLGDESDIRIGFCVESSSVQTSPVTLVGWVKPDKGHRHLTPVS